MKVILNEDVSNLGEEGDVREVARGYARNYLFPKNMALPYTKENIAAIENRRAAIEKRKEEKRQNALSLKEKLDGKEVVIKMNVGASGKLFGSVTSAMLVDELQKEGIEVEKKKIDVAAHTIKMLGTYPIRIKLYGGNEAEIKLKVEGHGSSQRKPEAEQPSAPKNESSADEAPIVEDSSEQAEEQAPETTKTPEQIAAEEAVESEDSQDEESPESKDE
ncbi:MAG TPA: 50S ribosomal protein L9 [Sediminispirochaeta sp.]|nr:50S ribosomal protein L9 [Sediminispirochaeta sp.]